jgi:Putative ER transporter, 6TM, N-terminal
MFCIYINIAMTYLSFFPSWGLMTLFLHRITIAFLTAYSLAFLVGLFIVPVSCRLVAFKEITGFLQLTRKSLKQQASHLHKLKALGVLDDNTSVSNSNSNLTSLSGRTYSEDVWNTSNIEKTLAQLGTLHSKLGPDVGYAQREVAFGCITASDMETISVRIQELYILVTGVGNIATMLRRLVRTEAQETKHLRETSGEKKHEEEDKEIADAMKILDTTFSEFVEMIDGAINHTLLLLELNGPSRKERLNMRKQFSTNTSDAETYSGESSPGQPQYVNELERRVAAFQKLRMSSLESWKTTSALDQTQMTFNFATQFPTLASADEKTPPTRAQQELLLLLWVSLSFLHQLSFTNEF